MQKLGRVLATLAPYGFILSLIVFLVYVVYVSFLESPSATMSMIFTMSGVVALAYCKNRTKWVPWNAMKDNPNLHRRYMRVVDEKGAHWAVREQSTLTKVFLMLVGVAGLTIGSAFTFWGMPLPNILVPQWLSLREGQRFEVMSRATVNERVLVVLNELTVSEGNHADQNNPLNTRLWQFKHPMPDCKYVTVVWRSGELVFEPCPPTTGEEKK